MARTKVNPKQLYENRNTSDVLSRLVIMGVLRILNRKLMYQQVWHDDPDGIETITVPFFFDFSGGGTTSERFIQDNYLHWTDDECNDMGIKKMPTDYKPIPYGVVSLSSTSIDTGGITNRFVYGRFTRKEGSELKQYVSYLYVIPLSYSLKVDIKVDTMNTMWKIEQAFRECFYKNKTFHFNYRGTVVPCRVGFSENLSQEKTAQYKMGEFGESTDIKMSFDLQCETYQPMFDPNSEMDASHTIRHFAGGIGAEDLGSAENGLIRPVTRLSDQIVAQGQELLLEWRYNYTITDLCRVNIKYEVEGEGTEHLVESVDNNNFYYWKLPDDIIDDPTELDITIVGAEDCEVITPPSVKMYPDPETNVVSEGNVIVQNKGMFVTDADHIDGVVSYVDRQGRIREHEMTLNLRNGMVDTEHPVSMKCFVYDGDVKCRRIRIKVEDDMNRDISAWFLDDPDKWTVLI